jgi:hypothetical protein
VTYMELDLKLSEYLDQVKHFYENVFYPDRHNKLKQIQHVYDEAIEIKLANPKEYPYRIIAIRRVLLNLLPIWGYSERKELNRMLDQLLEACRKELQLTVFNTSN